MKREYTPDHITELKENEIFVFGSTRNGAHLGGAARLAVQKFGAIMGNGFGPQGRSFAILSIVGGVNIMISYVNDFIQYAKANPTKRFLVTKIGCGRAKYTEQQVAPLFKEAYFIDNIVLPESFCHIIESLLQPEEIRTEEKNEEKQEIVIQEAEETNKESNDKIKIVGKIDLSQFDTKKQKAVRSSTKENIYIIDTNVFVEVPFIISKIDKQYRVVLSAKVIDELDKLKITLDSEGRRNVERALHNINKALDTPRVSMELSDVSLLPSDFNKRSPDNNILTVALKFQNDEVNPILLTSDNGLQVKAKGLGIATISLKEFMKRK